MPVKVIAVEGLGDIRIQKRAASRSLRLSIAGNGQIRVSQPLWVPYAEGLKFALSRVEWIRQHLPEQLPLLHSGAEIGKSHRLLITASDTTKVTSRLGRAVIKITRPYALAVDDPLVQDAAAKAAIRALRQQAEEQLPGRLREMAARLGFEFRSLSIKQLTGRWGSCDNQADIVLNLYLMQLPWPLIDYVLLHELVHTKHLNHSADFWREFERHEPHAKRLRSLVHKHQPRLEAQS